MPSYIFTGTLTKSGVCFFIDADSPEEARDLARRGKYDEYDTMGSETTDWDIDPDSCEVSE